MTVRERVPAPASGARDANPLLPLVSADPDDAWLLLDEIRQLPCNSVSAKWLDVLLDDPRLEALPQVREAAVQRLLDFGHPHALLINPEHLAQFRRTHPIDVKPGRMAIGAALALAACATYFHLVSGLALLRYGIWQPTLPLVIGVVWAVAIGVRALWTRTLRRAALLTEVTAGLLAAATLAGLDYGTDLSLFSFVGAGLLPSVVPVSLAGLAGGWSES